MAKAAGIAKGMVFHYFGSKYGLYEYLVAYAAGYVQQYFGNLAEQIERLDYIEQYRRMTRIKLAAYTENPYVFEFFTVLFTQPENVEAGPRVKELYGGIMALRAEAVAAVEAYDNTGLFRSDINVAMAKKYITWIFDGYTQSLLRLLGGGPLADLDLDPCWAEFDAMLDDLKTLFYRQEA